MSTPWDFEAEQIYDEKSGMPEVVWDMIVQRLEGADPAIIKQFIRWLLPAMNKIDEADRNSFTKWFESGDEMENAKVQTFVEAIDTGNLESIKDLVVASPVVERETSDLDDSNCYFGCGCNDPTPDENYYSGEQRHNDPSPNEESSTLSFSECYLPRDWESSKLSTSRSPSKRNSPGSERSD